MYILSIVTSYVVCTNNPSFHQNFIVKGDAVEEKDC